MSQEEITNDAAAIRDAEILFDNDGLDDVAGIGATLIEDGGTVALTEGPTGQYFVNEGNGPVALTGVSPEGTLPVTSQLATETAADTFIWTAVEAVEDDDVDGGYQLLWEITSSENGSLQGIDIWTFTEAGVFESDTGAPELFDYFDGLA